MSDPYDHNQLATLRSMNISYDEDTATFSMERVFDFSESPELEADDVAETWQNMFAEHDGLQGSATVDGELFTLVFESEGVETRHALKPRVSMVASEMISMLATHDTTQAVELAETLLANAEEADEMMD